MKIIEPAAGLNTQPTEISWMPFTRWQSHCVTQASIFLRTQLSGWLISKQ